MTKNPKAVPDDYGRWTPNKAGFRAATVSLWFQLISLGIIGLVFPLAVHLGRTRIQGWSFYLTTPEIIFETLVRLILAALVGIALGTVSTALLAPALWYWDLSRQRIVESAAQVAVVLVLFLDARFALLSLIKWSYTIHGHRAIFDIALLRSYLLVFAIALCLPRARKELVTSLEPLLRERTMRGLALAVVIVMGALVAVEFALSKSGHSVRAGAAPQPKTNILLVTFDALSAEDISFYGYALPTTPNLDAFARKSTVFNNFYSASTFTTPCIAALLTGLYPSESHVYQLQGSLRRNGMRQSFPELMRAAGYVTGSFISNPFPFYLARSLANGFDVLPEPQFRQGPQRYLWALTAPLHQESGIGSRADEYMDLESLVNWPSGAPNNQSLRFRPVESFKQAGLLYAQLPAGFFLWVHVMAPHDPYLPDKADQGRFLPEAELQTFEKEGRRWEPHYEPDKQSLIDRRRLAYDEYVASADRAFGGFMSELEIKGRFENTTVIVSSDHGESFEGGIYRHESPALTRPVIHVPLIIRTPGQQTGRKVDFTADQTAIVPTILELAGQKRPDWMHGKSLVDWLDKDGGGTGQGRAFTQFFEKNSVFKPLRHGTVGVIDGQYEYVLDLDTRKGTLRPLNLAQFWNLDRTAENPARAEALRSAILSRFPELIQKPE